MVDVLVSDGPDVRALRWVLGSAWGVRRPVSCLGCPFSVRGRPKGCALLGMAEVNHEDPPYTQEDWQGRARIELDLLESDNAALTAVASDARGESLMYLRGRDEGAAAEREACCKAVCSDCDQGRPVRVDPERNWRHANGQWCRAHAIRRGAEDDGS